jgi:hypothetical protein
MTIVTSKIFNLIVVMAIAISTIRGVDATSLRGTRMMQQIYTGDDEYDQDGTNETSVDDMDELDGFNDNNSTFSDDSDPMDGDENGQESTNEQKSTSTGADNDSDSNADSKADADADFRIVLLGDDYSSGNAASEDLSDDS